MMAIFLGINVISVVILNIGIKTAMLQNRNNIRLNVNRVHKPGNALSKIIYTYYYLSI